MEEKSFQELKYRIGLILKEELRAYEANGRIRGELGSYNMGLPQQWVKQGEIPALLSTPSRDAISSPNETILVKLYNAQTLEGRSFLINTLTSYLDKNSEFADVGYLVFRVLYRVNQMLPALEQARQHLWGDGQNAYSNVLGTLSQTIIHEYAYHDWPTLRALKELLSKDKEHDFALINRINSAEIKLLESELSDVNPEINADEQKLRAKFTDYGFPNDLNEALDHINKQLATASSGFDYKDCMAAIRGLTERLFERIAKAIDSNTRIDGKDSEAAAKFFKEKGLLSEDAAKLLTSLRHFLSNDGAHRLKSKPEDARLSKNITVELALYLLKRLDVVTEGTS